jgi:hypothetical protein
MKHGDIISVIWDDAHSVDGWMTKAQLEQTVSDPLSRVISAGIFVTKTKKALVITMGITDYGSYDNTLEIPLTTIVKTRVLEKSETNFVKLNKGGHK